ncbi:MAG: hypothetical protein ACTHJN_14245 [Ginsengibacter sp.]
MPSKINVQLTGRIQNLVFYKLGDRYCVRTVPSRVKQTKATKARGKQFGIASRAGATLRRQLLNVIPFPSDNNMQTRLVSAIYRYLQLTEKIRPEQTDRLAYIDGFQFTEGYTILERWKVALSVTRNPEGGLQLNIPVFIPTKNISAPAETVSVICDIAAGGFDRKTGNPTGGFSTSLRYQYNDVEVPEQVITMPIPMPPACVIVTAISFQYQMMKSGHEAQVKKKAFMPSGIVSAMYVEE